MAEGGGGLLELVSDWNTPDPATEFAMIRRVAAASGQPIVFSLTARHDRTEAWKELLALSEEAAEGGLDIRPVFPPRPIGILMGLVGSQNPFSGCPSYRALAQLPPALRARAMRDPATRAAILSEDRIAGSNFPLITRLHWARMFPFGDPPDYAPPRAASLEAQAEREGRTPEEVAYDLLCQGDGSAFIFAPLTNFADYTLDASAECLRHRHAIVGLSDGGAHVGFISDGSFPTFTLMHWSKRGFAMEELVRRQTSDTARAMGLTDRGILAPGMLADINLIAEDELALPQPQMIHDLPAGGKRLLQGAKGYRATLKRGTVTHRNGSPTGALPGKLLRRH